jgi:hypothetical protein
VEPGGPGIPVGPFLPGGPWAPVGPRNGFPREEPFVTNLRLKLYWTTFAMVVATPMSVTFDRSHSDGLMPSWA